MLHNSKEGLELATAQQEVVQIALGEEVIEGKSGRNTSDRWKGSWSRGLS